MSERKGPEDLVDAVFPVVESHGNGLSSDATAVRLGESGMEVLLRKGEAPERYAWLEFRLPGEGYRVKALGEVADVEAAPEGGAFVRFLFKHVFPRDRDAMRGFLAARAAA